jgi:hypothetical protein
MPTYNSAINTASLGTGFVYSDGTGILGIGVPSGGSNILLTKFTANGIFTKNVATKYIEVICWNGGGGGGSGRQGLSGAAGGGSGGAPGGVLVFGGFATFFSATETVTIGSGGVGGPAQSLASTDGDDGTPGGVSSLGNIFLSLSGTGGSGFNNGLGGANGTVSGGTTAGFSYPFYPLYNSIFDTPGGDGKLVSGIDADPIYENSRVSWTTYLISGAGGGGAGANAGTAYKGGDGSDTVSFQNQSGAVPDVLNAGGVGGIETGTIDGTAGNNAITTSGGRYVAASGGGAGGGQKVGIVAGNGGNGGLPSGGGAGGGGSIDGTNSGSGGNGGRGEVWVIEYY